jgi:multidrug efflux pump subunit AcrA (membrane-fusion protein)
MYQGDREFVYVASGDKASKVEVKTGEGRSGRVIVTSGLKAGDSLIVSGNRTLFDGALIASQKDR